MKKHLLSFVTNAEGDQVSVHADKAGLEYLISELKILKDNLDAGKCDHAHFKSPDWAGTELSTSMLKDQGRESKVVHDVKIYSWNDEWKRKHDLSE